MIDEIDRKILSILQCDGRISNADLAQRVSLSQSACFRRVKSLEQSGVITGYEAKLDPRRIGLTLSAFVIVNMEKHDEDNLRKFIAAVQTVPEIIECHAVSGQGDYILKIAAKDMDAYARFALHHLVRLPGVKDISSSFVLTSPKLSAPKPQAGALRD